MATTYCIKCGFPNQHDIIHKPTSCGRCKNELNKTGPTAREEVIVEASPVKNLLSKFKVQPISDEELGLGGSDSVTLSDLVKEGLDRNSDLGVPLEDTFD